MAPANGGPLVGAERHSRMACTGTLCVAIYESLARQHERDEGDFTGMPSHPLLTSNVVKEEPGHVVTFDEIIDHEAKRRSRGRDAKPLPDRTIAKYRNAAAEFAAFRGPATLRP